MQFHHNASPCPPADAASHFGGHALLYWNSIQLLPRLGSIQRCGSTSKISQPAGCGCGFQLMGSCCGQFNFSLRRPTELFVVRCHLAAGIVRQMLARIGVLVPGAGHLPRQSGCPALDADPQLTAAFHFPAVGLGVPVAQCLVVQRDGLSLLSPCRCPGKAFCKAPGAGPVYFCPGFATYSCTISAPALAGVG